MSNPSASPPSILVADDDAMQRDLMQELLHRWGYPITLAGDGLMALKILQDPLGPPIAILDWEMPGVDGVKVCRWLREHLRDRMIHIILLTAHNRPEDLLSALEAGADEFLSKPFNAAELHARIRGAERMLRLHEDLARKKADLRASYHRIMRLEKMMPICSYCKSIRDDRELWQQVDRYLTEHADARFSHGICPDCFEKVAREEFGIEPAVAAPATR